MTGPRKRTLVVTAGAVAGLFLSVSLDWRINAFAQGGPGGGGTTFTTSTDRVTRFEFAPACAPVGSSRTVVTPAVAVTTTIGPACIGIDEVSVPNPAPACGGLPAAAPPVDPFHGTTFLVVAGDVNFDVRSRVETFECVGTSSIPALHWWSLCALAALLLGIGGSYAWRRRHNDAKTGL